ncbi:MAG TPA: hypothetical protein VKA48_02895 [Gammaproteobacteria bacterium]|nr:hypothetical protein [Gammaproteobacteria bacterium]
MKGMKRIGLSGLVLLGAPALAWGIPYSANLQPLNGSGVTGTANLNLQGSDLQVKINASGLEPNKVHQQHIHGLFDNQNNPKNSTVPSASADTDGDGYVELQEGASSYGPVILPLKSYGSGQAANQAQQASQSNQGNNNNQNNQAEKTANKTKEAAQKASQETKQTAQKIGNKVKEAAQQIGVQNQQGDQAQQAGQNGQANQNQQAQQASQNQGNGQYPTASSDGTISFSQTYDLSNSNIFANDYSRDDLLPLTKRTIVLHGMTPQDSPGAGTPGEIDGSPGYKALLPVAAGDIVSGQTGQAGQAGQTQQIPEPGVLSLLAMGGLAFLSGFGRRFRKVRG